METAFRQQEMIIVRMLFFCYYESNQKYPEERMRAEEEQLKLLATNGMLVKRPLVAGDDFVLTGFKEKEWEEKLKR